MVALLREQMLEELTVRFQPVHYELLNESHLHHTQGETETHFKLLLISDHFRQCSRLQRHQLVNQCLERFFQHTSLHALSMQLLNPEEWQAGSTKSQASPSCRGGFHAG